MYDFEFVFESKEDEIYGVIESIWDDISEDDSHIEDLIIDFSSNFWIKVTVDGELAGYINLRHYNNTCLEFHSCLLKEYRKYANEMEPILFSWLVDNVPGDYSKFIALVPEHRMNVVVFALKHGWRVEGFVSNSYFIYDEYIGNYVLGREFR